MADAFEVAPYSIDTLKRLLSRCTRASRLVVNRKQHSEYFRNYFENLGAKTIVSEANYIDRDYLEDFAGYYVRCFSRYPSHSTRLHARVYEANLFGIPLTVKSLAYQEQDRVAAACATSALWSIFHATGKLFHHHIPSPVEITRAANAVVPSSSRCLPSSGLDVFQMAQAMRSVSLEPYYLTASDERVLTSTLYAYLRGRIPLLLGIELYEMGKNGPRFDGRHAVAVAGFRLGRRRAQPDPETGFLLRASRMTKIYAHDDQVGPFARMELDAVQVKTRRNIEQSSLSTSWIGHNREDVRAVPDIILVPLYHKIRIPFARVHDAVVRFDAFVQDIRKCASEFILGRLEWDIYLTTANDLKSDLLRSDSMVVAGKEQVLSQPMPRFIWRATGRVDEVDIVDLLFDATDIEQGDFFVRAVEYDVGFSKFFRLIARERSLLRLFNLGGESRIVNWFSKQPIPR